MDAAETALASPVAPRTQSFLDRLPLQRQPGSQLRRLADGSVAGDWFGCELTSVFQPIVDPADGRGVGYEAFLRCLGRGQRDLSPWTLFSANAEDERLIALDRLARTIHALNFAAAGGGDALLFLNVHGRLLAAVAADHGAAFRRVVDALGIDPGRIVIETPTAASEHVDMLAFVLRNYRHHGFRVAVNVDSPAQWDKLAPRVPADYVKLPFPSSGTGGLLELGRLAESGGAPILVLTQVEQLLDAPLPAGVLVQGFAYGRPVPGLEGGVREGGTRQRKIRPPGETHRPMTH